MTVALSETSGFCLEILKNKGNCEIMVTYIDEETLCKNEF